jgi:hypothetical protein
VDRETILKRKAYLEDARDQALASANAASGGIAECDFWLSVLAEAEKEKTDA